MGAVRGREGGREGEKQRKQARARLRPHSIQESKWKEEQKRKKKQREKATPFGRERSLPFPSLPFPPLSLLSPKPSPYPSSVCTSARAPRSSSGANGSPCA